MTAARARNPLTNTWDRVSGSDITLGTGHEQAARGDHDHANVPIKLFWTSGAGWPARPAGAYSVDWVGPAGGAAPPWTSADTWIQY